MFLIFFVLQRLCFYTCLSVHRGCLGPGPEGGGRGVWPGGFLGPDLGEVGGLAGGCPGPGPGGCPGPGPGGVSQHALRQTLPPKQTATAADGTHPTGMHSCLDIFLRHRPNRNSSFW